VPARPRFDHLHAGEKLEVGRRAIAGLLLGSETQHVLTHSTIPVVVWR